MKFKNIRNFRLSVIRRLLEQRYSWHDIKSANLDSADLRYANLIDTDLRNANLTYADLGNAKLENADLTNVNLYIAIGDGVRIINVHIDQRRWRIITWDDMLQIGCKKYLIKDWFELSDDVIDGMHDDALAWWREYKNGIYKKLQELGKL